MSGTTCNIHDMRGGIAAADLAAYGAIAVLGAVLFVVSARFPADMPVVGPYEFQWPIYLTVALSVFWYLRGLARLAPAARPALWRRLAFAGGVLVIWIAVQTGFEYVAQRMFFLNRIQHVAMHHIGPVLIGLSMAGPVIVAGGPAWLGRVTGARAAGRLMAVLQQPAVATVAVRRAVLLLAHPAGPFHRHARPAALSGDELDHGGRRRAVLGDGAGHQAAAAGRPRGSACGRRWRWR